MLHASLPANAGSSRRDGPGGLTAGAPSPWLPLVANIWWVLGLGALASVLCGLLIIFAVPRRYEASMTLAAVTTQRMPAGAGALAGLGALALAQQGLSATPDLVAQLLTTRRVLMEVQGVRDSSGVTIARRISDDRVLPPQEVEERLRRVVIANVDRKTGLVSLGVVHRDSALARRVATEVVAATSRTFSSVLRAQATEQRRGQESRVDSMAAQLRRAEEALLAFQSANRTLVAYAEASLERQRLERKIAVASQAYSQAATEREAALARELEQTPALVVLDPLPSELRRVPRNTVVYSALAGVFVASVIAAWWIARGLMAQLAVESPATFASFVAAFRRVPLLRHLVAAPAA